MAKINRNELCPCGSGRKFKSCHLGREGELDLSRRDVIPLKISKKIVSLKELKTGLCGKISRSLDIKKLTGEDRGIRFIDLREYAALDLYGSGRHKEVEGKSGGVFINVYKTIKADPKNIYIAVSPEINNSSLLHETAHALDYLKGSGIMPGTMEPLGLELSIPLEHLEHTMTYGKWLDFLCKEYKSKPDADDAIILFLYKAGKLIDPATVISCNSIVLKNDSAAILGYLHEKAGELNDMIKGLDGYLGNRAEA